MINRILGKYLPKSPKSILLLGPRQTGKSTLIKSLSPEIIIDLADELEFLNHSSNPGELKKIIEQNLPKTVFIDEIQRNPKMLNTVQSIVDNQEDIKFYITGSSARKLKRGQANLLPGRVFLYHMGPFVSAEFEYNMSTQKCLEYGTLPEAYLGPEKIHVEKLLQTYSAIYLKEEIKAEALTRNLDTFSRFLQVCTLNAGQFIDYTKLAKKAKISRHACPRYFEILEDTLVGSRLWPNETLEDSYDLIKHPKFYFFDNGVYNGLIGNFRASLDRVGLLAEQLIFNQLQHSAHAFDKNIHISTFRTRKGMEVDFIIELEGQTIAIEVKNSDQLQSDDFEAIQNLTNNNSQFSKGYIFHMGSIEKKMGKIWSLPWQKGLKEIGL